MSDHKAGLRIDRMGDGISSRRPARLALSWEVNKVRNKGMTQTVKIIAHMPIPHRHREAEQTSALSHTAAAMLGATQVLMR